MNERDFIVNCVTDYYSGSTQAVCPYHVQHDLRVPVSCSEHTPGATYQGKLRDQLVSYHRLYPPMIPQPTQCDNQEVVVDLKSYLCGVSVTACTDVLDTSSEVEESVVSNMQPPREPPEGVDESVDSNMQLPESVVVESVCSNMQPLVMDNRSSIVGDDEASGDTGSCDATTNTERMAIIPNGAVKKSKQPSRNDSGLGPSVPLTTSASGLTGDQANLGSAMADQGGASARRDSGLSEEANGRPNAGQGNQSSPETNGGSIVGWMRTRRS